MNAGHLYLAQRTAHRDPLASAWDRIADAVDVGDAQLLARANAAERELNRQQSAVRLENHHRARERQHNRDYYARNAEAVKAKAKARYAADLEQSRAKARESWHRRQAKKKEAQG